MLTKGHWNAKDIKEGDIHPYIFHERGNDFYTGMLVIEQVGGGSTDAHGFDYKIVKGALQLPCGRHLRSHAIRCYSLDDGYIVAQRKINTTITELRSLLIDIYNHPEEYNGEVEYCLVRVWNFKNFMKFSKINIDEKPYAQLFDIIQKSYKWMLENNFELSDEQYAELRGWSHG